MSFLNNDENDMKLKTSTTLGLTLSEKFSTQFVKYTSLGLSFFQTKGVEINIAQLMKVENELSFAFTYASGVPPLDIKVASKLNLLLRYIGEKGAVVISTERDDKNQATTMYDNYVKKNIKDGYGRLGTAILTLIANQIAENRQRTEIITNATNEIQRLAGLGWEKSKHSGDFEQVAAIDIERYSIKNQKKFGQFLKEFEKSGIWNMHVILPTEGKELAFHIEIKP
jgi:hypothetical protein